LTGKYLVSPLTSKSGVELEDIDCVSDI
jgi:hypothetical protein